MNAEAVLLTPRGSGAVATIRVCGSPALLDQTPLFRAANGRTVADQKIHAIVYGRWGYSQVESMATEDVVLTRTGPFELEIHCHGGEAAITRILNDLNEAGCQIPSLVEHQVRRTGRFHSELQRAVTLAPTLRTAGILLEQASGVLQHALEELRSIPWTDDGQTQAAQKLNELLARGNFGRHLTLPWKVAITGRPNVGKSTLMNQLMGYARSVVYDEPGTTRDIVTASAAFGGWPVELADTAGLREAASGLEAEGIRRACEFLETADCRVIVIDASVATGEQDLSLLEKWPSAIVIANKSDLPAGQPGNEDILKAAIRISAKQGKGIADVADAIAHRLVPKPPLPGTPIPVTLFQQECLQQALLAVQAGVELDFRTQMTQILS